MKKVRLLVWISVSWLCSCDRQQDGIEENFGKDAHLTDKKQIAEDVENSATLREEARSQMEQAGYFVETNSAKKNLILLEVVGQIAPNMDYRLVTEDFPFLADELKMLDSQVFEGSLEEKRGALDLHKFLDLVYERLEPSAGSSGAEN